MSIVTDGIPPLLNGINKVFGTIIDITALGNLLFSLDSQVKWGIYLPPKPPLKETKLVLEVDGFVEFELQNASQVASYRIEKGQFAAYNKVDSPYSINLVMIKNGTPEELTKFISELNDISNDIELYNIVTPNQVFTNANMLQYSYRQSASEGYNTLYVYCTFMQILSTAEIQFNNQTKTQSGQKPESVGIVTPAANDDTIFTEQELLK